MQLFYLFKAKKDSFLMKIVQFKFKNYFFELILIKNILFTSYFEQFYYLLQAPVCLPKLHFISPKFLPLLLN